MKKIVILALAVVFVFMSLKAYKEGSRRENGRQSTPEAEEGAGYPISGKRDGTFRITTSYSEDGEQLRGVVCSESGKRVRVIILEPYCIDWEIRVDGRKDRTYFLNGRKEDEGKENIVRLPTDANVVEARILPGQYINGKEVTEGRCAFEIY